MVIGTTGFDDAGSRLFREASQEIAYRLLPPTLALALTLCLLLEKAAKVIATIPILRLL